MGNFSEYNKLTDIHAAVSSLISKQERPDLYKPYYWPEGMPIYKPETVNALRSAYTVLCFATTYARNIDKFISGKHDEQKFIENLNKDLHYLNANLTEIEKSREALEAVAQLKAIKAKEENTNENT